jgi:hypothetical protein
MPTTWVLVRTMSVVPATAGVAIVTSPIYFAAEIANS